MAADLKLTRVGTSSQYPISLEDAKDHLHIDFDDDDTRIKQLIKSVVSEAQHFIGKPIYETLWQSDAVILELSTEIKIPYIQSASVQDYTSGAAVPNLLHCNDSSARIALTNPYTQPVKVMLAQQYLSEDLDLTLLLTVAFYYERRDLSRFSEQTLATLRKRLIYHRDAIVSTG
jgi:hypothetical protein